MIAAAKKAKGNKAPANSATCPVSAKMPAPIITPVPIAIAPNRDKLPDLYSVSILFIIVFSFMVLALASGLAVETKFKVCYYVTEIRPICNIIRSLMARYNRASHVKPVFNS
jgi:hypothetical protein